MLYTFNTVVMDRELPAENWRSRLRAKLASKGVRVVGSDDDAELWLGDRHVGWARLEALDGVAEFPALAHWAAEGERPWAGRPIGLFRWNHPMSDSSETETLVRSIILTARGATWNRTYGELLEAFTVRHATLVELTHGNGLDAGAALIERDPGPYLQSLIEQVRGMLQRSGLDTFVGHVADGGGNTLRVRPMLWRGEERVPDEDVLATLAELGAFEFIGVEPTLGNDACWRE